MNSKNLKGEHVKLRDEIPLEERIVNHNKLLNLVNYKKSLQDRVYHKFINNIFQEKEKLLLDLQLLDHGNNNESTHTIFFEDVDDCLNFNAAEYFETDEKLLNNKTNRLKKTQLEKVKLTDNEEEIKQANTLKKIQYNKLSEKIKNSETLKKISNTLDYQKHLIVILNI